MPFVRKTTTPTAAAEPGAAEVLRALSSANPDERWAAARAAVGVDGGCAALAAALRAATPPQVRAALFTSRARIGTPESIGELIGFLRSDQSTLRTGSLDALRTLGADLREILPQLLKDADPDIRILSCELARVLPAEEAATVLCDLLEAEADVNVCAAAIDVLAELASPAARPVLARCAGRFPQSAFLGFAVQIALDRITSASERPRD